MLDQPVPNPLAKNPNVHTHKVFAAVGLILIGVIIAVAGIWYYVENQTRTNNTADTAVDETTTTKVSTSSTKAETKTEEKTDKTADWKTYTNSTYGFSIKYPTDWSYNDADSYAKQSCEPGPDIPQGLILFGSKNLNCVGVAHMSLWDEKVEFVVYSTTKFDPLKAISGEQYSDIVVDGQPAVKNFKTATSEGPRCDCTRIYVNNGAKGFMIEFVNKDLQGNHDSTYDTMLSTFKFL